MENQDNVNEKEDTDEKVEEKEYRRLQIRLEEYRKRKKKYFVPLAIAIALSVLSVFYLSAIIVYKDFYHIISMPAMPALIAMGIILAIMSILYTSLFFEIKERKIQQQMLAYDLNNIWNEVEEDIFENSIKMSYKYLDQYYLQTREQAQRGFFVTVCVAVFGAFLISKP